MTAHKDKEIIPKISPILALPENVLELPLESNANIMESAPHGIAVYIQQNVAMEIMERTRDAVAKPEECVSSYCDIG